MKQKKIIYGLFLMTLIVGSTCSLSTNPLKTGTTFREKSFISKMTVSTLRNFGDWKNMMGNYYLETQ